MRDTSWTATGMRCSARELESASAASTSSLSSCSFISSSARYLHVGAALRQCRKLLRSVLHESFPSVCATCERSSTQQCTARIGAFAGVAGHDLVQVELRRLARGGRGEGGLRTVLSRHLEPLGMRR